MEIQGNAQLSELHCHCLRAKSIALNVPRKEGILSLEVGPQNDDLAPSRTCPACGGGQDVALDGRTTTGNPFLHVLTANEEILPESQASLSLATIQTVSTELYIPPTDCKDEPLQDGCASSFKNDLQIAGVPSSPVKKLEDSTPGKTNCRKRAESSRRQKKRRKRSETELATENLDAAIGMIISASEAVVVGQLIDSLNLAPTLDRSILLEAALSLGKARHLSGLDNYELITTTMESEELAIEDLDHRSMQQVYADVGMIVDVVEDEHQLLDIGTEVVNLRQENVEVHARACPLECSESLQINGGTSLEAGNELAQNCKSVGRGRSSSEVESGKSVAAEEREFKVDTNVDSAELFRECDKTGDRAQLGGFGMKVLESTEDKIKESTQSSRLVVFDSLDVNVEMGKGIAGDHKSNAGHYQQDTEVLQESGNAMCEKEVLGVGGLSRLDGGRKVNGIILRTECCKSVKVRSCTPEDKFGESVPQGQKVNPVIIEVLPESDMDCTAVLGHLSSSGGGIHQKATPEEGMSQFSLEFSAEDKSALEISVVVNKATQTIHTEDPCGDLIFPSETMASKSNQNCPDAHKNAVVLKAPPLGNTTTNSCTPYISRWFGGWSGKTELDLAAQVGEEGNTHVQRSLTSSLSDVDLEIPFPMRKAFLGRRKSTPVGKETLSSHSFSVAVAQQLGTHQNDKSVSRNDEIDAAQCDGPQSEASTPGSHLSSIDPLCSFVPCSISPPAAVSSSPGDRDPKPPGLAGTIEAFAHGAMNMIDSRKKVACLSAGPAVELERLPDSGTRTNAGASGLQSLENPQASVSNATLKDSNVKRLPTTMRRFSTTNNSLSLVLQAIDIAGKSLGKDRAMDPENLEQPRTTIPNIISRSSLIDSNCPEPILVAMGQAADSNPETSTVMQDGNSKLNGKGMLKQKEIIASDIWTCADLSDSPPLLWPRGRKKRLKACRVIDTDSMDRLPKDDSVTAAGLPADEHEMVQEDSICKEEHTMQNSSDQSVGHLLRKSTRSKICHDSKTLFKGLHFLLTGFSAEQKGKLSESIKQHGGGLLADIPPFSHKQRFKRRGVDCGARSPPIVIAPQQVRTPKFLYGCAVGSPLLNTSWIRASISAVKCSPYHLYQHRQTRTGCLSPKDNGGVSKSTEGPLFIGLQFLFHGQQDFISQLSALAKHAGGKVIRKLVLNGSALKQRQMLVGVLIVEGSSNMPLDLQRTASHLKLHVVDAEWMVQSLFSGKLVPFPNKATTLNVVCTSQQSSSSHKAELQRCSRRPKQICENLADAGDGDPGIDLFVKKLKSCSVPDENGPNHSTVEAKLRGRELEQGHVDIWLGKGFTSPPRVPQLADGIMGPYTQSLAFKKLPKKFSYYEEFLCNGVEYFVGDNVEVRTYTGGPEPCVARIEGLWSEEGKLPQTRAFQQGVRKMALKNVVLKCRRYYRPSDTGFPGQFANELYLSNKIDQNLSASDVLKRVRVTLGVAGVVVQCNNWYEDQETASTCQEEAPNAADYMCSFFYDHEREALHRIKLKQ